MQEGFIEKVVEKDTSTGKLKHYLTIGGTLYNGWGPSPVSQGDYVRFDFKEKEVGNETFHDLTFIEKLEPIEVKSIRKSVEASIERATKCLEEDGRSKQIRRMACLKAASPLTAVIISEATDKEHYFDTTDIVALNIKIAKELEKWVIE